MSNVRAMFAEQALKKLQEENAARLAKLDAEIAEAERLLRVVRMGGLSALGDRRLPVPTSTEDALLYLRATVDALRRARSIMAEGGA